MNMTPVTGYPEGQISALLAVDIAEFGAPGRDDDVQYYLRAALYNLLECAFNQSGLPWAECACEDRGDGALIVIPPEIPVTSVLSELPRQISSLLRHHNRLSSQSAHMQLRVAAHVGYIRRDRYGFTGNAIIHIFRLLDAPSLRQFLANSRADMAFAVSDYVFTTLICRNATATDPGAFRPLEVEVKETSTLAWAHLLGTRHQADISPLAAPQVASVRSTTAPRGRSNRSCREQAHLA
jgi:hypothetical protein